MRTEEDIIYSIWDIVRGGEFNQDDPANERLLRAFLRIHRGKLLFRSYTEGAELPDEVFQYLGAIPFTAKAEGEFLSPMLPKTHRFRDNFGFMVDIQGYPVSVVNSESWRNARKDRFNRHHPLIKFINNHMVLSPGLNQPNQLDNFEGSELNTVVNLLGNVAIESTIPINVQAVLVDPDDEPGYDFTSSPYPLPDELVEDLINSVNAREFNLFLRVKSDETADLRNDAKAQDTSQEF